MEALKRCLWAGAVAHTEAGEGRGAQRMAGIARVSAFLCAHRDGQRFLGHISRWIISSAWVSPVPYALVTAVLGEWLSVTDTQPPHPWRLECRPEGGSPSPSENCWGSRQRKYSQSFGPHRALSMYWLSFSFLEAGSGAGFECGLSFFF